MGDDLIVGCEPNDEIPADDDGVCAKEKGLEMSFEPGESKCGEWECYLFGSTEDNGFIWAPQKGNGVPPNWFWRWMQYLFFGNRWVKRE